MPDWMADDTPSNSKIPSASTDRPDEFEVDDHELKQDNEKPGEYRLEQRDAPFESTRDVPRFDTGEDDRRDAATSSVVLPEIAVRHVLKV